MRCLLRIASHLLLILSVSLSCRAQDNSCTSSHNVEELQQLRLEHLKTNILAQLGFTEPPELPPEEEPTPGPTPDDIADSYNKLETYTDADAKCTSGDFFAKPVKSFVGVLSPAEGITSANALCTPYEHFVDIMLIKHCQTCMDLMTTFPYEHVALVIAFLSFSFLRSSF